MKIILNSVESTYAWVCMISHVWLFVTPRAVAWLTPLSMGFSRQEYWSALPFPSPGGLPKPGIEHISPVSPALIGKWVIYHCAIWEAPESMFSSAQLSRVHLSVTPWTAACQASLSITNSWSRPKPMPIESVMPSCHPTISSSVVPFSSCSQSLPATRSFQMSQLFTWGGQNIGVSASTSVLPMNTQDWSPLGWTGWISL